MSVWEDFEGRVETTADGYVVTYEDGHKVNLGHGAGMFLLWQQRTIRKAYENGLDRGMRLGGVIGMVVGAMVAALAGRS